jgi:hypothetical protein
MVGAMVIQRSSERCVDDPHVNGARCDRTVLIHHDLSTSCSEERCAVPIGSDQWAMADRRFHGCDYVLRRCPACAVEPATPSWAAVVEHSAA